MHNLKRVKNKIIYGLVAAVSAAGVGLVMVGTANAAGTACTVTATYGSVTSKSTSTISIPANGVYRPLSRMALPSTSTATSDTYYLEITKDGTSTCLKFTKGSALPKAWNSDSSNWVKADSDPTLTAGTYSWRMLGTQPDVEVDRIIFARIAPGQTSPSSECNPPISTGDACAGVNVNGPTVSRVAFSAPDASHQTITATIAVDSSDTSYFDPHNSKGTVAFSDVTGGGSIAINNSCNAPVISNGTTTVTCTATYDISSLPAGDRNIKVTPTDTLGFGTASSGSDKFTITDPASVAISGMPATGATMLGSTYFVGANVQNANAVTQVDFIITKDSDAAHPLTISDQNSPYCLQNNTAVAGTACTLYDSNALVNKAGWGPGTDYHIVARVHYTFHTQSTTADSSTINFSVNVQKPSAPGVPTVSAHSANSLNLQWIASSSNPSSVGIDHYTLVRHADGQADQSFTIAGTTTSYADSGLSCNTPYTYTLTATDKHVPALTSDASINNPPFTTDACATKPTPPASPITATANAPGDPSQVTITWGASTASSGNTIEHYTLKRSTDGGASYQSFPGNTTDSSTFTFTDTGVSANTTYQYVVTATDTPQGATSNPSAPSSSVHTPPIPTGVVTDPGNPRIVSSSITGVKLCWLPSTESGGTVSGYYIWRSGVNLVNDTNLTLQNDGTLCFTDTTAQAFTQYTYQIQAHDGGSGASQKTSNIVPNPGLSTIIYNGVPGDVTGITSTVPDGIIDHHDMAAFNNYFNLNPPPNPPNYLYDVNQNGAVNGQDLAAFINAWITAGQH